MNPAFWTNTIWYLLLGVTTIAGFAVALSKTTKRRQATAYFLTILGITLIFETAILIFLKSYIYYPKIINAHSPFDDALTGNLFSQFSISATLLLVAVLDMEYYWYSIFALLYGLIEELFLHLGIYRQNWYGTWMTVGLLPFAFMLLKKLYRELTQGGIKPVLYYGFVFLGLFPLNNITLVWALMIAGLQDMSDRIFTDPVISRYTIVLIHYAALSLLALFLRFSQAKKRWKTMAVCLAYILYYLGYRMGFLWIKAGWFLPISTVSIVWMVLSVALLDWLYGRPMKGLGRRA